MKPIANSQAIPSHTNAMPSGARGGVSSNRLQAVKPESKTDVIPFKEKWAKELAWAAEHLPEEHPGFAAVAIQTMKRGGTKPTTKSVLAHLEASGRDRKSTDALAERYR